MREHCGRLVIVVPAWTLKEATVGMGGERFLRGLDAFAVHCVDRGLD